MIGERFCFQPGGLATCAVSSHNCWFVLHEILPGPSVPGAQGLEGQQGRKGRVEALGGALANHGRWWAVIAVFFVFYVLFVANLLLHTVRFCVTAILPVVHGYAKIACGHPKCPAAGRDYTAIG